MKVKKAPSEWRGSSPSEVPEGLVEGVGSVVQHEPDELQPGLRSDGCIA